MAKTIMIQGTCSNAGKSLLCAAFCRIFPAGRLYRVAPFKSQRSMALNSFITADGRRWAPFESCRPRRRASRPMCV